MASLYKRNRSPCWWIKYRDAGSGKIVRRATQFKIGTALNAKHARAYCKQLSYEESITKTIAATENWDRWVVNWINAKYDNRYTKLRYLSSWDMLSMFLDKFEIPGPRALTREHCLKFVAWRTQPDLPNGKFKAAPNTAKQEIAILSMIVNEAIRRGFAATNPCRQLGLKTRRVPLKPEYTDDDIEVIRAAIDREPEPIRTFLKNSSEIARYHGCRIAETYLNPMADVDILTVQQADGTEIKKGIIRFKAKGDRLHETVLHPKLIPLFEGLKAKGQTETYPKLEGASGYWSRFLRRIGMTKRKPGACFHSFRVTAVTRLARSSNVSEAKAMKFIGHASTTIHRTYQRLRLEDLGAALDALG